MNNIVRVRIQNTPITENKLQYHKAFVQEGKVLQQQRNDTFSICLKTVQYFNEVLQSTEVLRMRRAKMLNE